MSASFFVTYHGVPVRFDGGKRFTSVKPYRATVFISVSDAWYAAYQADLLPQFTDVESANNSAALSRDAATITSAATEESK